MTAQATEAETHPDGNNTPNMEMQLSPHQPREALEDVSFLERGDRQGQARAKG